ncbi:hypothetical protein ABIC61_001604, partial [Curtobacterium sp. 1544]
MATAWRPGGGGDAGAITRHHARLMVPKIDEAAAADTAERVA